MNTYKSLFLCGFRATGKSSIGPLVAKKIGWEYIEMDAYIQKKTGKSISELTKNGTDWVPFRQTETSILKEITARKHVVVSCGGGVGVNTIVDPESGNTFGEIQKEILKGVTWALTITLHAKPAVIAERFRADELKKKDIQRPILNEARAKKLEEELAYISDPIEKKNRIIDEIVADSLAMYEQRHPLYKELSPIILDTSTDSPELLADEIITILSPDL